MYFIYLFYEIILQTFKPIWAENKYMGAPSRREGTPRMRLLTPTHSKKKEPKQMNVKVIFLSPKSTVLLRVPQDFIFRVQSQQHNG